MSIVKNRRQEISRVSSEEGPLKPVSISSKSKIIKKASNNTSIISVAIDDNKNSSVKSSNEETKRQVPSSAVYKKNKFMLTQSGGGNTGRYPYKQPKTMADVIAIALNEIRREHSIVGDYNAVVGDLVMKQKERKVVAEMSSLKDRDQNQNESSSFSSAGSDEEN